MEFLKRLKEEKAELAELENKLNKLDQFLESEQSKQIDDTQLALLKVQATAMNTYFQVLKERLERLES